VVLIGPSTPLSPALFELAVDALAGFVARDAGKLAVAVSEAAAVSALRPYGRYVMLRCDGSDAKQGHRAASPVT
jgi:uncharacterized protein (DUF4213/DUF364 family)